MSGAEGSGGSTEDRDSKISTFCSITGVEAERGQFYLESANWDIQLATQQFYETSDDSYSRETEAHSTVPSGLGQDIPPPTFPSSFGQEVPMDVAGNQSRDRDFKPQSRTPSKFGTLSSLQQQESDSSSDEEGQAFYAGGSSRSGQQVLGPSRKKDPNDVISQMFKSAKEHGAQVVSEEEPKIANRPPAFKGSGYRLGTTENDSTMIASPVNLVEIPKRDMNVTLRLWRNGFSVDDGPLRTFDDPGNREFLSSINRGEIPSELIRLAKGAHVDLRMEDHRHEEYVRPKSVLKTFGGEGYRLGSPSAAVVMSSPQDNPKENEEKAKAALNLDEKQPVTNIQIRLADGTRLVIKMNLTHTISDIRNYICNSRPHYAATTFILMTTFPNKELEDESLTIKEAQLANASIVQRLK